MTLISCYLSMLSPSCYLSMCFFVHVCLPEAPRGQLFLSCSPSASPGLEQSLTPRSLQSTCSESRGSKRWAGWWNLVVVGMFCILTVSAFWLWYWTVVFEMLPLREMEWGSICIISYNCMWIYNDFKKKSLILRILWKFKQITQMPKRYSIKYLISILQRYQGMKK